MEQLLFVAWSATIPFSVFSQKEVNMQYDALMFLLHRAPAYFESTHNHDDSENHSENNSIYLVGDWYIYICDIKLETLAGWPL